MSAAGPDAIRPVQPAAAGGHVALDDTVLLRTGAEVVARVVSAQQAGGKGMLSLAGVFVRAELPAGLVPGQRLPLTVVGQEGGRILLQVRREEEGDDAAARLGAAPLPAPVEQPRHPSGLAAEAAVLALPGGVLAVFEREPDESGQEHGGEAETAGFVLHSPALGAIEIRVGLSEGHVWARVSVDEGESEAQARAAAGELATALEQATGRPAGVDLGARRAGEPSPTVPRRAGGFDAWA